MTDTCIHLGNYPGTTNDIPGYTNNIPGYDQRHQVRHHGTSDCMLYCTVLHPTRNTLESIARFVPRVGSAREGRHVQAKRGQWYGGGRLYYLQLAHIVALRNYDRLGNHVSRYVYTPYWVLINTACSPVRLECPSRCAAVMCTS